MSSEIQPETGTVTPVAAPRPAMTCGLTFLFTVAGGAAVANMYWAQPLLDFVARGPLVVASD